ncbi:MAG TPA: isochorismatase family cysteine hydrolase [Candidatus Anoxymicrobiaceae bacterium]
MEEDVKSIALLVMDVQTGTVDRLEKKDEYVERVSAAVAAAHEYHIPVIYVVVGFRSGFPEVSASNKTFNTIRESAAAALVDPRPVIEPANDDVVVVKRRVSAFSGSDLEVILRAWGIKHLVLAGISTSGVVLSTTREAADKDYQLTILSDLCADLDAEVHAVLLEKVFPRQATVITSEQWINIQEQHTSRLRL